MTSIGETHHVYRCTLSKANPSRFLPRSLVHQSHSVFTVLHPPGATLTSVNERITTTTAVMEMAFDEVRSAEEKRLAEFAEQNGGIEKVVESYELKVLFEVRKSVSE